MAKDWNLKELIDYTSGDSWNGTHDRTINVTFTDSEHVTVANEYNDHGPSNIFTLAHITDELDNIRDARYFSDFCFELARVVPGAQAIKDERGWYAQGVVGLAATPKAIDREIAAGTRENVVPLKPLSLGSKAADAGPKPFALKLKI